MQKTFAHFDTDNDGFITQEELSSMAKEKGFDCDASAVNSMMLEVDLNSDGRIDFQEVCWHWERRRLIDVVYSHSSRYMPAFGGGGGGGGGGVGG